MMIADQFTASIELIEDVDVDQLPWSGFKIVGDNIDISAVPDTNGSTIKLSLSITFTALLLWMS